MSNRRDFLKSLGVGAAIATVTPQVTTLEVKEEPKTPSSHSYYHYEKPLSEYDRETYKRLREILNRGSK